MCVKGQAFLSLIIVSVLDFFGSIFIFLPEGREGRDVSHKRVGFKSKNINKKN